MYDLQPAPFRRYEPQKQNKSSNKEKPRFLSSAREAFQFADSNIKNKQSLFTSHTPPDDKTQMKSRSSNKSEKPIAELVPWNDRDTVPMESFTADNSDNESEEDYDENDDNSEEDPNVEKFDKPVSTSPEFNVPSVEHSTYYPYFRMGNTVQKEPQNEPNLPRIPSPYNSPLTTSFTPGYTTVTRPIESFENSSSNAKLAEIKMMLEKMGESRKMYNDDNRTAYAVEELSMCVIIGVAIICLLDKLHK